MTFNVTYVFANAVVIVTVETNPGADHDDVILLANEILGDLGDLREHALAQEIQVEEAS